MPDAREYDLELHLGFLIHDASRLRRSAFDRYLKPLKVTRSQCLVLAQLSRQDGITQSHLASNLDLGKVAIGGLIDRLEKNGLVRRGPAPNDRRVHLIYLAPKSKRLLTSIRKANHEFNARILAGTSGEQLATTAKVLEIMKRNLRQYLGSAEGTRGKTFSRTKDSGSLAREDRAAAVNG